MKVWLITLVSLLVGVICGVGSVWLEFGTKTTQFEPHSERSGSTIPRRHGPKAEVVGKADHDFGIGQRNSKMKHTFVIGNVGDEPLTLEEGETTCKCTLSELEDGKILPGKTANVLLDWKLVTEGDKFRQTAMISTNDPNHAQVALSIHGTVVDLVKLEPSDLVLSSVSISEETQATFLLLGYTSETMTVESYEFTNAETRDFFDLTFDEASIDVVQEHENAKCGLVGTLTVKPGLPLGPINQTIHIKPDVKGVGTLDMAVSGSVVSDISILGTRKFHSKANVLDLGSVDRNEGAREKLRILVKGEYRKDVSFEIVERSPEDVLAASLGEAEPVGNGAVYMHTLDIEIGKGARPVSCVKREEYGNITLSTTHPDVKTIPIYVKFSVR